MATRTWVSGVGDDANPCSRTAPCKTLAGAISKTNEGGEINALDPGGFGAVTITKPITIDLSHQLGGVLNAGTSGIIINIDPTVHAKQDVTLRGLAITGSGDLTAGACYYRGLSGIRILKADNVLIEDTAITGQINNGIEVASTTDAHVLLDDVSISNVCGTGINVAPGGSATAAVLMHDSSITGSGLAIRANERGAVRASASRVFNNATALERVGSGVIDQSADTRVFDNTDNSAGLFTIFDAIAAGPQGAPGPSGAAGPQGPAGTPAEAKLVVVFGAASTTSKSGAKVALPYASTDGAKVTVQIKRGSAVVDTITASAKAGKNTVAWDGKVGSKKAPKGTYTLALTALAGDRAATDTTKVVVK